MARNAGRDWRGIGCAVVVGASIAFPLGFIVGDDWSSSNHQADEVKRHVPGRVQVPAGRDVYSPQIANDPYVIEEQRKVQQALEVSCREFNRYCAEAAQARLRIEEADARR